MKRRKALSVKNRMRQINIQWYAVLWLLMDRWQPAGWVWGATGTICAVLFALDVADFFTAEDVELP